MFLEVLRAQHVVQPVIKRAQIGVHLALQVAGQEAQLFPGFDGGAGQDNAGHPLLAEGGDRRRNGKVGFARARGADAKRNGMMGNRFHIFFLAKGLGFHRLALGGDAQHIACQGVHLAFTPLAYQAEHILDGLRADGVAAPRHFQQGG